MRALRVLGLAESGQALVCDDPATGEQFTVPCDERLRAAARGDLSRFGQLEIEGESQLRPKEIQARIRAGASVDQIAALAGTSIRRIERYAHPVLLERITMAERARKARPSIDGISASASVEDTVAATLAARGHDGAVGWDAHREDDAWVLTLTWQVGRSENRAHWTYHPGAAGGTLTARDEAAAEIVDPALRILRPLREVGAPAAPMTAMSALLDPTLPTVQSRHPAGRGRDHAPATKSVRPPAVAAPPGAAPRDDTRPVESPAASPFDRRPLPVGRTGDGSEAVHPVVPEAALLDPSPAAESVVEQTVTDERSGALPPVKRAEIARTGTDSPSGRSPRKGRPAMPSWEDVLLGTRTTGRS